MMSSIDEMGLSSLIRLRSSRSFGGSIRRRLGYSCLGPVPRSLGEGGSRGRLLPAGQVAGQHVDLQIDPVADLERAKGRRLPGVRDDVDAADLVLHFVA